MKKHLNLKSLWLLLLLAIYNLNTQAQCNLVVNYTYTLLNNGAVAFSSTSSGTTNNTTYSWQEEFSTITLGTSPSFTTTFNNGTYNIYLYASNSPSCGSTSPTIAITVSSSSCSLNSGFSYTANATGLVNFSNTTTGTNANTSYNWDFGDGTSSNLMNPSKTYTNGGIYSVTLKTFQSNSTSCRDSLTKSVWVMSTTCIPNANFTVAPSGTPLVWLAIPSFPWNVGSAVWNWGDGSSSNTLYTSHTYSAAGLYNICLTVMVNCASGPSTASTCSFYSIFKTFHSSEASMIQINVVPPNQFAVGLQAEIENPIDVFVYPNPSQTEFTIKLDKLSESETQISLLNILGEEVYRSEEISVNGQLSKNIVHERFATGIYTLKISNGNRRHTQKLMFD